MGANNQPKENNIRKKINLLILLLLLVILPAGSWYYLRSGFSYQKQAWSELKDYGQIPSFNLTTQEGVPFKQSDLKGKIVVSNFLSIDQEDSAAKMDLVKKMHVQFDDRKDMVFVFYGMNSAEDTAADLKAFAEKNGVTDHQQCIFLNGDDSEIRQILQSGFKVPQLDQPKDKDNKYELSSTAVNDYPYFILSDTSSMIRNYYDYREEAAITRMIEHIAMILPRAPEKDIELRRDKEK